MPKTLDELEKQFAEFSEKQEKDRKELILKRESAQRDAKQFQIADRIRDRLTELGFTLEDGQDGTRWRRA